MRRLGSVPLEYVAAICLAVALGSGIYLLRPSHNSPQQPAPQRVVTAASAPAARTPAPAPSSKTTSDVQLGRELLARARRAYARVPAVVISGHIGAESVRFTLILHAGKVIKEAFVGTDGSQTTMLVAPNGAPTFAREPGSRCWRRLRSSDGQSLTDVGEQFPTFASASIDGVTQTASGWIVRLTANGTDAAVAINRKTYRVPTILATAGARQATQQIQPLASTPTLTAPVPSC